MPIRPWLSYALKLGNRVYWTFIFPFFFKEFFFTHRPLEYELFFSRSIDGNLTDTLIPGLSGPRSNCEERYSTLSKYPGLEPHHQMKFCVILRTTYLEGEILLFYMGYNQRILSLCNRALLVRDTNIYIDNKMIHRQLFVFWDTLR